MPAFILPAHGAKGRRPSGPLRLNIDSRLGSAVDVGFPLNGSPYSLDGRFRGTITGAAQYVASPLGGQVRQQLSPASTAKVDILPSLANWSTTFAEGGFAIWVRMNALVPSGTVPSIVQLRGSGWDIGILNGFNFGLNLFAEYPGASINSATPNPLDVGKDYLLAVTWSKTGDSLRAYTNGIEWGSTTGLGTVSSAPTSGLLGNSVFDDPLNAAYSDFWLFKRPLTAQDMWSLWEPSSRWDLYWVPGRRAFFDFGAASTGRIFKLAGDGGGLAGPSRGLAAQRIRE